MASEQRRKTSAAVERGTWHNTSPINGSHSPVARDAFLRKVVENAPVLLFALAADGTVTSLEGKAYDWHDLDDAVGASVYDLLRRHNAARSEGAFRRALAGEDVMTTLDIHSRSFDVQLSPVLNDRGDLAGVFGIALDVTERKQNEDALRNQNAYLAGLHETTLALMDRLDINELLENIVRRAAALLGTEHGFIDLVEPNQQEVVLQVGTGIFTGFIGFRMVRGEGVGGKVWMSGEPLVVESYDQWSGRSPNFSFNTIHAAAGVPLKSGGEVVGVIGVAFGQPGHRFTPEAVRLLSQFAELASVALDNARLYTSAQQEIAERRRTEEALRQSEERYRTIIETIEDGYYETDLEGSLIFVNDALSDIFGFPRDQLLARNFSTLCEEADRKRLYEMFDGVYRTGRSRRSVDGKIVRANGDIRVIEMSISLLHDSDDVAVGFRGIVRDSTERKAIERRNLTLLQTVPDMMMVVRRDGSVVEFKADDGNRLALSRAQVIDTNVADLPFGSNVELLFACLELAIRTGDAQTFDYTLHDAKGVGHFEARVSAVNDEEVLVIIRDITGRKATDLELKKRIDLLGALQDIDDKLTETLDVDHVLAVALETTVRISAADAAFIGLVDDDRVTFAQSTPGYPTVTGEDGLLREEATLLRRVIESHERAFVADVTAEGCALFNPAACAQIVMPLVSRDTLVGVLALDYFERGGFDESILDVLELLTARIAVALDNARLYQISQTQLAELKAVHTQVSDLEQLKTQMIRVAAHDLRSPIGVVSGYLSLIQDELINQGLGETFLAYLDPIHRAIDRMQRMTTSVLSLERIHATQAKAWLPVNLRETVDRAFLEHLESGEAKTVDFEVALPDLDVMVLGDGVQIYEAATNLISNAIKYTPEGGRVTVTLRERDDCAVFEVVDTGMGVPDEYQPRLFEPFFRVKTQETRLIDGTGLGLYLVKSIIERHGGVMIFRSVHGQGSTFGFELPLLRA